MAASHAADDGFARAWSLTLGGDADEACGRRADARRLWTEAASVFGAIGARTRWAYAALRIAFLDVAEGDHAAAERRLTDVRRVAGELSADDLHAAVANLCALSALGQNEPDGAEAGFRSVWESASSTPARRAVAGLGLAVAAAIGKPGCPEARAYVEQVRGLRQLLLDPLTRRAVDRLLDNVSALDTGQNGGIVRAGERLLGESSVRAALC